MVSDVFRLVHEFDFFGMLFLALTGLYLSRIVARQARMQSPMPAAICAFVVYVIVGVLVARPNAADGIFALIIRGVFVAWITLGITTLLIPGIAWLNRNTIGVMTTAYQRWRFHRRAEKKRLREEWEKERELARARARWAAETPMREEQERKERRRQEEAAAAKERRDKARASCELVFAQHAPDLNGRFTREDMERFFTRFMSESHPVAEVERRAGELRSIIERHSQEATPRVKARTIADLAAWYMREKENIESLTLEDELKQIHLVQLDMRYAALSQSILEGAEP